MPSAYDRTQGRVRGSLLLAGLVSVVFLLIALTGPSVIRSVFWAYFGLMLVTATVPLKLLVSNKRVANLSPDPLPEDSAGRAWLRITRARRSWRATGRVYQVIIDRRGISGLSDGESKTFDVLPGAHRVRIRVAWTGSEEVEVSMQDGETKAFSCEPSRSPFVLLHIFRREGLVQLYEDTAHATLGWSPESSR